MNKSTKVTQEQAVVYTLASGKLFSKWDEFQEYCEGLINRPIWTHEFASDRLVDELKKAFETKALERLKEMEGK